MNPERVWLERALWMVVGSLGILAASSLVSVFASLTTVGIQRLTGGPAGPVGLGVYVAALCALLAMVWRSGRQGKGVAWSVAAWFKAHPVAGATGVALFFALSAVSSTLTGLLAGRLMPGSAYATALQWRWFSVVLPVLFWPVVLGWLLKRTAAGRS